MQMKEILERIAALAKVPQRPGELVTPPPELIAFNVRMTRSLMQLKVSALAAMAGVSVSTIERVERAEVVSNEVLDKIAVALGEAPGYFWAPRALKTPAEMAQDAEQWSDVASVDVKPLRKENQVRELARCHGFVVNRPFLGPEFDDDIKCLIEWIDLTGFVLTSRHPDDEDGRRDLYRSVLDAVQVLERRGTTVLVGVMEVDDPGHEAWRTAVISVTPKDKDPGAIKGRAVFIDRRLSIGHRPAAKKPVH